MALLILGLALFFGAHLTPTAPDFRLSLVGRLGLNGYKLGVTLLSLAGLASIVIGASALRGSSADALLWSPPLWTRHLAFALMFAACVLIVAVYIPSHIGAWARHPMLAGVAVWALAHLLANGDLLALLLFGGFGLFAVYDRISLEKRGAPVRPAARGWGGDALALALGGALWAAILFKLHALAGAPLL